MDLKSIWTYTAIVLCAFGTTTAQSDILYDLDEYKQVTFKLDQLLLMPEGGLYARDIVNTPGESATFDPNIGLDVSFSRIANNDIRQFTSFHSIDATVANDKHLKIDSRMTSRSYQGDSYILTGYDSEIFYQDRIPSPSSVFARNEREISLSGNFGFGFGRMEYINHAWMAILILQSLQNQGLLLKTPKTDEITELADMLGIVRRARLLDERMRNIEILSRIVTYLQEREFVDPLSVTAILVIQDTYSFDEILTRQTGSRLEFAMKPQLYISKRKDRFQQETDVSRHGATGTISYLKEKNMDVKWSKRHIYSAVLTVNQVSETAFQKIDALKVRAAMTYDWSMAYLHGARTNLRYGFDSEIFFDAEKAQDVTDFSSVNFNLVGYLRYNYWFTPRTRAQIRGSLNYADTEFQYDKYQPKIFGNLGFNIVHALL